MKFFVPGAADDREAESIHDWIRQFVGAPPQERRIHKLAWRHRGRDLVAEVGKPLPEYFELGAEPVLAIFDAPNCYLICTPTRGGEQGFPIVVNREHTPALIYFFDLNASSQ